MKIIQWIQKKRKEQKGFTLLFAVLVSTLVVAVGATVVSIALRQTILSGTSRESQYAFYAANTVLECVFYWDVIGPPGAAGKVFPGPGEPALDATGLDPVKCAGGNISSGDGFESDSYVYADNGWIRTDGINQTVVKIEISDITNLFGHRYCAEAIITKSQVGAKILTQIEARGYNTCDFNNPRAVERGLVQSYES